MYNGISIKMQHKSIDLLYILRKKVNAQLIERLGSPVREALGYAQDWAISMLIYFMIKYE